MTDAEAIREQAAKVANVWADLADRDTPYAKGARHQAEQIAAAIRAMPLPTSASPAVRATRS